LSLPAWGVCTGHSLVVYQGWKPAPLKLEAGWTGLSYGAGVTSTFQTPDKALGVATGNVNDIVSLGEKGTITLTFAAPIQNRAGWDFAVFENGFSDTFLELAFVEVSSNGTDFVRFENRSLTETAVSEFGGLDPTDVSGLAGKYRIGYGTPFDLSDLALSEAVIDGRLNLSAVTHVRVVDIAGDGTLDDSGANPIYDPYPTQNSAGFDLEAVGIRYTNSGAPNSAPGNPVPGSPLDGAVNVALASTLTLDGTSDADRDDIHLLTRWQMATEATFQAAGTLLDIYSCRHLTSLFIPELILGHSTTYYWRAQVRDGPGAASGWSTVYTFTTTGTSAITTTEFRDWDNDGVEDTDIPSFSTSGADGTNLFIGIRAESNIAAIESIRAYRSADFSAANQTGSPDTFPAGLFGLKLKVVNPDLPATFTVYLSEVLQQGAYWYSYDTSRGWWLNPYAAFNTERTRITVSLHDGPGKPGDNDGARNGYIVFAGGFGSRTSAVPETAPAVSGNAGVGEQGGCLIATVQDEQPGIKAVALAAVMLLALLIAGLPAGSRPDDEKE